MKLTRLTILSDPGVVSRRVRLGIAGAAIYIALACWAKLAYVDPAPKGAVVVQLYGPFVREAGFAWRAGQVLVEDANRLTDEVVIYEDGGALKRADSFRSLSELPGQFQYERGVLLFSVHDDPNRNGRRYWAVVPQK